MSRYERTRERRRTLRTVFGRCYDVLDRRHVVIDVVRDRQVPRRRHQSFLFRETVQTLNRIFNIRPSDQLFQKCFYAIVNEERIYRMD